MLLFSIVKKNNMNQLIALFPGQGSQEKGMGAGLFQKYPEFVAEAEQLLGYDISNLCISDPQNQLQQTQYTQPALYIVNALHYMEELEKRGVPDVVLGHSLGEYNALWAAGVFDFATGLKIVQKRGQLMAEVSGGGMAAVIGLTLEEVQDILDSKFPELDVANINTPTQTVIAGRREDILRATDFFEQYGAGYVPLNVSGAFHSRYMQPVQDSFAEFLEQFSFAEPLLPVFSNVEAKPYPHANIANLLARQITSPVLWMQSIIGLHTHGDCTFFESGPKEVLSNMVKKINRHLPLNQH